MGGRFFTDWALWAQMCFVLGCTIILTFMAGFAKLAWNHWRLRKYTAIAEARKTHLLEMRRSRDVIQLKGEDVPFGVRAIESGIEVEGVWISRPNSPVPSLRSAGPASPMMAPADPTIRGPRPSGSGQLSLPQVTHRHYNFVDPETTPTTHPTDWRRSRSSEPSPISTAPLMPMHTIPLTLEAGHYVQPRSPVHHGHNPLLTDHHTFGYLEGRGQGQEEFLTALTQTRSKSRTLRRSVRSRSAQSSHSNPFDDIHLRDPDIEFVTGAPPVAPCNNQPTHLAGIGAGTSSSDIRKNRSDPFLAPSEVANDNAATSATQGSSMLSDRAAQEDIAMVSEPLLPAGDGDMLSSGTRKLRPEDLNQHLHCNKTIRKVNSGFEVLPAGTFTGMDGMRGEPDPSEYHVVSLEAVDGRQPRQKKLQKRARPTSIKKGRISSFIESL
ncbi:MAG: hypothetical protein M1838_003646 [Thelocarpon superellum]|nr:MAG: hypothetical protein M1838_003646 [Thelocarpon superellum]